MATWVIVFLIGAGSFFVFKLLYVLAAGGTLPVTKGALFVSTSSVRLRAFLDTVAMRPEELLVDLGCGDGRVLRAAHRRYGVRALGIEINPLAFGMARVLAAASKGVHVKWGSFWSINLGEADVVFCYLFPDVLKRLVRKLEGELRPGTRVVSCNFSLPGWQPHEVLRPGSSRDPIYVYRFPEGCGAGRQPRPKEITQKSRSDKEP